MGVVNLDNLDWQTSMDQYETLVTEALRQAYPGTEVIVTRTNTTNASPGNIYIEPPDPDLLHAANLNILTIVVPIWGSWSWLVYTNEDNTLEECHA